MFPRTLALVDDDAEYGQYLAQHLVGQGVAVTVFDQSPVFLAHPKAFEFDFYLLDLSLPGIDGIELIKIIRLRTSAGVVVVSGRASPDVFASIVKAGADMYLAKPVEFDQVALAIQAVHRRSSRGTSSELPWRLDRHARDLVAPDGTRVSLSDTDLVVMNCLAEAHGEAVTRETLRVALGYGTDEGSQSSLNATIFRLRRRIERATPLPVPLQAKSRLGYQFRGALSVV
jgi:two-component system, OmpR family, response regulator